MNRGKKNYPLKPQARVIEPGKIHEIRDALLLISQNNTTAQVKTGDTGIPQVTITLPTELLTKTIAALASFKHASEQAKVVIRDREFNGGDAEVLYKKKDLFEILCQGNGELTTIEFNEMLGTVQKIDDTPMIFNSFLDLIALQAETVLQPNPTIRKCYAAVLENLKQPVVEYLDQHSQTGWLVFSDLPQYIAYAQQQTAINGATFMAQFTAQFHQANPTHSPELSTKQLQDQLKATMTRLATERRFYFHPRDRWILMELTDRFFKPDELDEDLSQIIYGESGSSYTRQYLGNLRECKNYEEYALTVFSLHGGFEAVDWTGPANEADPGMLFAWRSDSSAENFNLLLDQLIMKAGQTKIPKTKIEKLIEIKAAWAAMP